MNVAQQRLSGVTLGDNYPYPVIDPQHLTVNVQNTRKAVRV